MSTTWMQRLCTYFILSSACISSAFRHKPLRIVTSVTGADICTNISPSHSCILEQQPLQHCMVHARGNCRYSSTRRFISRISDSDEQLPLTTLGSNITLPIVGTSNFLNTLWKFSRPHTILGSGLSVLSVFAFATPPSMWRTVTFWKTLFQSMIPALFMNLYITGLNQVMLR